jgi:ABC-type antimicrobial peptide transport system permease subunit
MALGADARRVWWAVTRSTLRQLVVGVALGAGGAAAVARILPALLVGAGGGSVLVFAGVALVLLAVGVVASAIPARRATRLDAVAALQTE